MSLNKFHVMSRLFTLNALSASNFLIQGSFDAKVSCRTPRKFMYTVRNFKAIILRQIRAAILHQVQNGEKPLEIYYKVRRSSELIKGNPTQPIYRIRLRSTIRPLFVTLIYEPIEFSHDPWPILGAKSPVVVWTRANRGQGMLPWLQQTFVWEEDCVTSPKNVSIEASASSEKSFLAVDLARFVLPSLHVCVSPNATKRE